MSVAGLHLEQHPWADLHLEAIRRLEEEATRHDQAQVVVLAGIGQGHRLDVVRPPPARLEHLLADDRVTKLPDLGSPVCERPDLVGSVKQLPLHLGHGVPHMLGRGLAGLLGNEGSELVSNSVLTGGHEYWTFKREYERPGERPGEPAARRWRERPKGSSASTRPAPDDE